MTQFAEVNGYMKAGGIKVPYTLGLDIGSNSVGWAILINEGKPIAAGTRVFTEGTNKEKGENSQETSRAAARRLARQTRRQGDRRRRRWRKVAHVLLEHGLLPSDESKRHKLELADPYELRKRALSKKLAPHEIGKAIYHLSKRRGFQSSRKGAEMEDEKELKTVAEGIQHLRDEMGEARAKTLGAYLAQLDPHEDRRRGRYLHRDMVREELDLIWEAQSRHHPGLLTSDLRTALDEAIFHQRPLKPKTGSIGVCILTGEPRAPRASWYSHQFRLLGELNNLRIVNREGLQRELTTEERNKLLTILMTGRSDVKFTRMRKTLKLADDDHFNLEEGERPSIKPNYVESLLSHHFGNRWNSLGPTIRDQIWEAFITLEDEEFDREREEKGWPITKDDIKAMARAVRSTGSGYTRYSLTAIRQILPKLEEGMSLHDARAAVFPEQERVVVEKLPQIDSDRIINPIVRRALSEIRKLVNALIREHGAPERIVIEMARSTKGTMAQRNDRLRKIRANEKARDQAREVLLKKGITPNREAIRRYLLWEECGHICPYTGKAISLKDLFGEAPKFELEHILPYSRTFDNSMFNTTLCHREENRLKKNRTPYEAYSSDPEKYERVKALVSKTRMPWKKKKLFSLKEIPDDFRTSQLHDTSHAAREIREYLYQICDTIDTSKGPITANLRHYWGLNSILSRGEDETIEAAKERGDHRHHAIDAAVVAATNRKIHHRLSNRYAETHFELPPPYPDFRRDLEKIILAINVSQRPERKLNAGFSKDTNYGRISHPEHGDVYTHRVHLADLAAITPKFLEKICDPGDRDAIVSHLRSLGCDPEEKIAKLPDNWTRGLLKKAAPGRVAPPIRKVRVFQSASSMIPIPEDKPTRFVDTENNHHAAIYQRPGGKLLLLVCSRYDAMNRQKKGEPIVQPLHPDHPDARCVLWFMKNDALLYLMEGGTEQLYRVVALSGPPTTKTDLVFAFHTVAKTDKKHEAPLRIRIQSMTTPKILLDGKLRFRKVTVDPLGRIFSLNDAPNP